MQSVVFALILTSMETEEKLMFSRKKKSGFEITCLFQRVFLKTATSEYKKNSMNI